MISKMKVLKSELEFRKYIILNSNLISKIIIFEDSLEGITYFYCFSNDEVIAATKELSSNIFSKFREIYVKLSKVLNFNFKLNVDQLSIVLYR